MQHGPSPAAAIAAALAGARRGGVPALSAQRPPARPLLDLRRPWRRPRPLALRPPLRRRQARRLDGCRNGAARRPARPDPPSHQRADAARGARRGSGASSPWSLPRTACRRRHRTPARVRGAPTPYDATEAARRLWRRCRAVDGSHAERYLQARGLSRCRFAALRFHPELRYREGSSVRRFPALVAAVTGGDGRIFGVQRTWLDPRRPAKAGVADPRARRSAASTASRCASASPPTTLRSSSGRASRRCSRSLTAVPEIRAAAALSAGSLGAFAPPPGTARLVIARDNDEDGALAAERLARRCARAGVAATVIVPAGNDFNDDLVALGSAALRARFAPLFRCAGGRGERRVGQADRESGGRTWTPSSI